MNKYVEIEIEILCVRWVIFVVLVKKSIKKQKNGKIVYNND